MLRLCLACKRPMPEGVQQCPHCNFMHYASMNNDEETYRVMMEPYAEMHRADFLSRFDMGITTYHWKDQDGTVVLDTTKRLSLGTAQAMRGNVVWLDQEFARLPDVDEMTVELSVHRSGAAPYGILVALPALKEPQLQRLGMTLTEDLKLRVLLKNQDSEVSSEPVEFMLV